METIFLNTQNCIDSISNRDFIIYVLEQEVIMNIVNNNLIFIPKEIRSKE